MTRAETIARARGEAAAARAAIRLADAMRAAVPDARVAIDGEIVTVTGRGLSAIIWPAGLLR